MPRLFAAGQVRARPLSESNPDLSKYMEGVAAGGPAQRGKAFASLTRRGRGDADADSMTYDEASSFYPRYGDQECSCPSGELTIFELWASLD